MPVARQNTARMLHHDNAAAGPVHHVHKEKGMDIVLNLNEGSDPCRCAEPCLAHLTAYKR